MRAFIFTLLILLFKLSTAQQSDRQYTFKEVGWTITLPTDFNVIDSTDNEKRMNRGKKVIEEANDVIADASQTRTLISATKNIYNYFNSTITPYDSKTDGDYKEANKTVKNMVYKALSEKMPDASIDSSTTIITIDGINFGKFGMTVKIKEKATFSMVLLYKFYKGYDFGISYVYLDEKTREQIEYALKNSKFVR